MWGSGRSHAEEGRVASMGCSPELLGQRDQNVVKHRIKVGITSPIFRAFSIPNILVLDEELHEVVSTVFRIYRRYRKEHVHLQTW